MDNLSRGWGYRPERGVNTEWGFQAAWSESQRRGPQGPPPREGSAHHQLDGGVTAHRGLRLAGLRGRPAALGLRHCPDSYGRLQSRIIRNGRKPDDATLRGG